jgi:hypothetical protein
VAARAMPPMHRRGLGGTSELAPWPSLPRNLGAPGRFFYAYVFLAAVPDVRRWHRQRNIPDDVSWATLADLGRHLPVNRRVHGEGGLDRPLWLRSHFRGALYQLGRLQFCRSRIPYEPAMLEHLAVPFRYGDPALDLHIPEQGPLTPPACNRSLRWARDFFPRHFSAERPIRRTYVQARSAAAAEEGAGVTAGFGAAVRGGSAVTTRTTPKIANPPPMSTTPVTGSDKITAPNNTATAGLT